MVVKIPLMTLFHVLHLLITGKPWIDSADGALAAFQRSKIMFFYSPVPDLSASLYLQYQNPPDGTALLASAIPLVLLKRYHKAFGIPEEPARPGRWYHRFLDRKAKAAES
jgi:hypothetical protein